MGRINQYPKASAINDSDTLLGVVGGTTKQVAKDILLSGVTNDISNTTIVGKKAGKVVTADDSSKNRLPEITAYGKSVQNTYSGKNELEISGISGTTTWRGITYTLNDDKSITLSGTATELIYIGLDYNTVLSVGESYTVSISKTAISGVQLAFGYFIADGTYTTIENGWVQTSKTVTIPSDYVKNRIVLQISSGTTVNATIYPMIRKASIADDTFEPFVGGEASPNPSYPQAITSVADDKSLVVKSCGKNLFMLSEVGAIDANGNDVTQNSARRTDYFSCKEGDKFTISKNIAFVTTTHNGMARFYDKNKKFVKSVTALAYNSLSNTITIPSGVGYVRFTQAFVDGDYLDVEYQIERGDKATEYDNSLSEATLSLADDLRGIPVAEGGNYTDESGQSWICDTIEKYADGTGKYIQRVCSKVLNGSEPWYEFTNTGGLFYQYYTNLTDSKDFSNVMCTHFTPIALSDRTTTTGVIEYNDQTLRFALQPAYGLDIISKWKEWLAENNATVFYALAEPIEIPLTAEQMAEFEKLMSFEGYTTVYTDDMGEIAITYFKNSDSGKIVGSLNDRISNLVALLQSNGVI